MVQLLQCQEIFFYSKMSRLTLGPTQLPLQSQHVTHIRELKLYRRLHLLTQGILHHTASLFSCTNNIIQEPALQINSQIYKYSHKAPSLVAQIP